MNREKCKSVFVKVPARFHMDVMNIQKLVEGKTAGGGIGVAIKCYLKVCAYEIEEPKDIIECDKHNLVKYYVELLRNFVKTKKRFYIKCTKDKLLKNHNGMGLNALYQIGISYAINNLIENPLDEKKLIDFLKKNYYEEENGIITRDVFCTGVAHNTSINGGICFVSETANILYSKKFPKNIVVGVIKSQIDNSIYSEKLDNDKVIVKLRKQQYCNQRMKNKKEIVKSIINDLQNNDYTSFFEEMKEFSKNDDSLAISKMCIINNLQYSELCKKIEEISNSFVRISSNAPYLYVLTDNFSEVKKVCQKNNISIKKYEISNEGIEIKKR